MDRQFPKVLAIVPCYNEAGAIGNLLQEFSALNFLVDTLVIDDGSQDQTYSIAKQFSQVLRLEKNQGVAAVIKLGIGYALENDYDFCIQIDGDGQHIPSEISKFIGCLKGTASPNILIGSRYCRNPIAFGLSMRRIAGLIISFQLYLFFGRWICDPLSGMRMMDRTAMQYFVHHIDTYFLDAAIVPYALHAGISIIEIPTKMRLRETGDSHVHGLKGVKFMLRLMWCIVRVKTTTRKAPSLFPTSRTNSIVPNLSAAELVDRKNFSNTTS